MYKLLKYNVPNSVGAERKELDRIEEELNRMEKHENWKVDKIAWDNDSFGGGQADGLLIVLKK